MSDRGLSFLRKLVVPVPGSVLGRLGDAEHFRSFVAFALVYIFGFTMAREAFYLCGDSRLAGSSAAPLIAFVLAVGSFVVMEMHQLRQGVSPTALPDGPPAVLIVEDHHDLTSGLRRHLERRGWAVRSASTAREALPLLSPPPRFVLLDLMLPDGPGEYVLQTVRWAGLPTKVLVMSGTADPERIDAVGGMKPDGWYTKGTADFADGLLAAVGTPDGGEA